MDKIEIFKDLGIKLLLEKIIEDSKDRFELAPGESIEYDESLLEGIEEFAKEKNMPLEINLLGYTNGRHYPRELFWEIAGENGCMVVLGSDAHIPAQVVDPASEEKALILVEKYGLQLLEHVPIHPYI